MADTPTQTDAPVLPADANPMTRAPDVPPDQWPVDDVATIELLQNSPAIMGARGVASKMSAMLAAGVPPTLSENDQLIVDAAKAQAGAPPIIDPPLTEDPDMQAPTP